MPRKKNQGVQLQRKTFAFKTSSLIELNKTDEDAKTNVVNGERSPSSTPAASDSNYLHKKFKKVAGVTDCTAKTTIGLPNGYLDATTVPKACDDAPGRYVCPYCHLACAKPSVLQKHVRAHTNERPFPCTPCGFAFKTKSNLYKHCRSQAHRIKTGLGEGDSGGSDVSEDSSIDVEGELGPSEAMPKIYKPKFHKAALYQSDSIPLETDEANDRPKLTSQSSELLQQRISKIIRDNQVIFETMEAQFCKKFMQRQNSREKEVVSPKPDADMRRIHEAAKSKLALALLKVDKMERSFSPSYPKVNSENQTYQPLNLTKKPAVSNASLIKEILIASREAETKPERMAEILTSLGNKRVAAELDQVDSSYSLIFAKRLETELATSTSMKRTLSDAEHSDNERLFVPVRRGEFDRTVNCTNSNVSLRVPSPLMGKRCAEMDPPSPPSSPDVGPRLGSTPLIDAPKKRRVQSTTVPPDPREIVTRRFSTSSLPSTLQSLEELSKHPLKMATVQMFGGEVKILDCGEPKTVKIQGAGSPTDSPTEDRLVVTVAKPGLHSSGGTLLTSTCTSPMQWGTFLSPDTSGMSIAPNIKPPDLAMPGVPPPDAAGIVTIRHGDRTIPHVPGIPGPHTTHMSSLRKPSSSSQLVPSPVPKIEVSACEEETSRKFLRPSSLPLKPGSFTPKRLHQGTTPTVLSLVSPETPRPKKSYGQLFLNGHAYTYLGLKCSTRSYYCTISRPQPMYVVQSPQLRHISMYSNWKVYSETDPLGLTPGQAMAQYDSRNRTRGYASADTNTAVISTHSSSCRKTDTPSDGVVASDDEKAVKENGDLDSSEDFMFMRARGRGRFVCEECGTRWKKPSQLRKHMRTHGGSSLSCKNCSLAFKSKGSLAKHLRSKAHYHRCVELGVEHNPPSDSEMETETSDSESNFSSGDDDFNDDGDNLEDVTDGTAALEREAACSLLRLSSTPRVSQCVAAGILPKIPSQARPSCYPYTTAPHKDAQQVQTDDGVSDEETPMDLSQKEGGEKLVLLTKPAVPAYLVAGIANHQARPIDAPGGHMLQAYLTAKALHDVQIKQKQRGGRERSPEAEFSGKQSTVNLTSDSEGRTPSSPGPVSINAETRLVCSNVMVVSSGSSQPRFSTGGISVNSSLGRERSASPRPRSKTSDLGLKAEFFPPASGPNQSYVSVTEDGRSICVVCNKTFTKPSQLRLHVNIHYFERPYRCEACGVSFRTKGHLQKHERSVSHHNKVSMNTTFGAPTTTNPRPFKCDDCKSAFRIHGHLAKHLRSKLHIMKLECIGKLPFGTYAELERSGYNLNEIDTTDCENSLESLQVLAQKLYEKDGSKLGQEDKAPRIMDPVAEDSSSSDGIEGLDNAAQCNVCGEICATPAALQVHLLNKHNRQTVPDKRKPGD